MKKFKYTPLGKKVIKQYLKQYINKIDVETKDIDFERLPDDVKVVFNIDMYVNSAYVKNQFESIEHFVKKIYNSGLEYNKQELSEEEINAAVLETINNGLNNKLIKIVNYNSLF